MQSQYGGYRIERERGRDASLRASACVVSVHDSGDEVFRIIEWVVDQLGRRKGRAADKLAADYADALARDLIDRQGFMRGVCYRRIHGFDPMRGRETVDAHKFPLDTIPVPPL